MFVAMPLIAWGADAYAKKKAKEYESLGLRYAELGANSYQIKGLSLMSNSPAEKAAWLANSDRNLFGFSKVPFIGLGALASMIGLSALHSYLPAVLFSIMPAAVVLVGIEFLAGAGIYTYINRNKQIDNRFKLTFTADAKLKHELYLEEDLTRVAELTKDFQAQPSPASMPKAPGHFNCPMHSPSLAIQEVEHRLAQGRELRLA